VFKHLLTQQKKLINTWKRTHLRLSGVKLDPSCYIGRQVFAQLGFANGFPGQISLLPNVKLEQGVILQAWGGSITIQDNVFIGPYTVIYGHGGVTIGQDSLIAMHCRILSSNHTIPEQYEHICWKPDILMSTTIGKDVWLGAGVTILGGVTIGDGCVVGAGAVVTKNLPPYSIAIGVPAKVIKIRT
jgi:acetyltransferase-like isoleucine patch superfamily enzyme